MPCPTVITAPRHVILPALTEFRNTPAYGVHNREDDDGYYTKP